MPDKFLALRDDNGIIVRYVDQGDGTWAVKSNSNSVPGPGGGQQIEGNQAAGTTDTGNPVGVGYQVQLTPQPIGNSGQRASSQGDGYGAIYVVPKGAGASVGISAAGTNVDGATVITTAQAMRVLSFGLCFNGVGWDRARGTTVGASVVLKPEATGGSLFSKIISAASTNATAIKASAASVVGIDVYNSGAAVCFLKLYNKASAPVVGTDIPVKVIAIPPGAPREINRPLGEAFTVGLAYAITTGFADADTGAVTAGQVTGSIDYA